MNRLEAKLIKIGRDPKITAKAAGLRYISDCSKGFFRQRAGKGFFYTDEDGKKITSPDAIDRFRKLVIPPAWEKVWICPTETGHLQVTGIDAKGRKQYRYHPEWNALRNQSKFYRMREFAKALPAIRSRIEKDLKKPGLKREKVMALIVSLLEQTHIRIGNDSYNKLYGSFGLTTLKDRHLKKENSQMVFEFIGKKGVRHKVALKSPKLRRLVQRCKEIPGKELFQYLDEEGNRHSIDSGQVNQYIQEISGDAFSAKDFRCWSGSVLALEKFAERDTIETEAAMKKKVVSVIDEVASELGNTRSVCKKYYVHPTVIAAFESGRIDNYRPSAKKLKGLDASESALVRLLKNETIARVAV